jgi:hypothetical protein
MPACWNIAVAYWLSSPESCFVAALSAATKQTVLNALAKRYIFIDFSLPE